MQDRSEANFVKFVPLFFTLRGWRWGFEYSRVGLGDTPYLDRYIMYAFGCTLRLHKFWRGDDDRAPHDHPWTFWTFPFRSYVETVELLPDPTERSHGIVARFTNVVRAFRLHKRQATYRHIVKGRADGSAKPFWTIVVTGPVVNRWGFWTTPYDFVPWREWPAYVRKHLL